MCVGLSGHEPELQENSDLPYYCPRCVQSEKVPKSKSKGRGKCTLSSDSRSDVQESDNTVRRSTCIRKLVKRTNFIS